MLTCCIQMLLRVLDWFWLDTRRLNSRRHGQSITNCWVTNHWTLNLSIQLICCILMFLWISLHGQFITNCYITNHWTLNISIQLIYMLHSGVSVRYSEWSVHYQLLSYWPLTSVTYELCPSGETAPGWFWFDSRRPWRRQRRCSFWCRRWWWSIRGSWPRSWRPAAHCSTSASGNMEFIYKKVNVQQNYFTSHLNTYWTSFT